MTATPRGGRVRAIAALIACFYAGAIADWWLREKVARLAPVVSGFSSSDSRPGAPPAAGASPVASGAPAILPWAASQPSLSSPVNDRPVATTGEPTISSAASPPGEAVDTLQRRGLVAPIDGIDVESMKGSFDEHRTGAGGHEHDAVDILSPRNTPVRAVDDGTVAKLFYSKAGGITLYQFDPSQRFCYYYAHLERYADGLRDGQKLSRGDVIGYVGTSGNAPPGTPHLHFAVYELTPEHRWWQGRALDPYLVFRR